MSYSTKLEEIQAQALASLRMRRPRSSAGAVSFTELATNTMRRKCITYRRHGEHGELLKPMHHRFEVKGGRSAFEALADNLSMRNPLFDRLARKP